MAFWASLVAQLIEICLQCRRPQFDSWVKKIHWRKDRLPTPILLGFPGGSDGKESTCNAGDLGLIPGLGRDPLKEGMATHSSILAWRIPWTEEPGGLRSMGLQRVGHNRATAHMAPCIRFTLEQESQDEKNVSRL